jgi:hypothetical protein
MTEKAKDNALFSLIHSNIQKETKVKNKKLKAETILHIYLTHELLALNLIVAYQNLPFFLPSCEED